MQKMLNLCSVLFLGLSCLLLTQCSSAEKKSEPVSAVPAVAAPAAKVAPATPSATSGQKQASGPSTTGNFSCAKGSDVHTTSVASKDGGCELTYTKAGAASTPAHAHKGNGYCIKKAELIKSHLEAAGYTCTAQ
jgi:hypothetical protein